MSGPRAEPAPPALPVLIGTIFLPFACGYYLSFFYRSVNAVIAPRIVDELGLGAGVLGLLTAAYFLAFGLFQLPLGILLDRYGPRRVQSLLLLVACAGAVLFALGRDSATLAVARGMIGIGVSGCLVSAMTAFLRWLPAPLLHKTNAWFLVFGGLGLLTATQPLEWLLALAPWRTLFFILSGATALTALVIFLVAPERGGGGSGESLGGQLRQLGLIYRDGLFWRVAPICGVQVGAVFGIQGLWATPWLRDVEGLAQDDAVRHLVLMALSFIAGTIAVGYVGDWFQRRQVRAATVMAWGLAAFLAVEALLVFRAPIPSFAIWPAFTLFGNLTALAYAMVPVRYPKAFAGRALTALNIVTLASAFGLQWLIGLIVDLWPSRAGAYPAIAYEVAFGAVFAVHAAALVWYLWPGRNWWSEAADQAPPARNASNAPTASSK